MSLLVGDTLSSASAACLDYLLRQLDGAEPRLLPGNTGLPAGSVETLAHNLVLAPTPVTEPMFSDALLRFARASGRDVLLVRHGFHPEILDPVRIDVAVRTCTGPILIPDTSLLRHADGGLHLVPAKPDLFVEITATGLDLSLIAPWNRWDERSAGLERAAAEIVRACRGPRA